MDVLVMKLSEMLAQKTHEIVYSVIFRSLARKRPEDFTRNRKMPFEDLIFFMIFSLRSSIPTALRRFFEKKYSPETMTQQSLSEARAKLTVEGFKHLFQSISQTITEFRTKKWNGYRLYAVDGVKITLPDERALIDHFGGLGKNADSPTGQGSALYDVLNDNIVDAAIEPLSVDERTLANRHIDALKIIAPNDRKLVLFDRGYPYFSLIDNMEQNGLFYVMRVKTKFNLEIDAQTAPDGSVWLEQGGKRVKVRVIKFKLDSGETETLITNILDRRLGKKAFKKLYFMRWPIETKFNVIKNKLQLENFSSKTVEGIQQEFFASMYLTNLVASAAFDAQSDIEESRKDKGNKFEYKANTNELIGILKDHLILALATNSPVEMAAAIDAILEKVKRHVIPIRSERSTTRSSPRASKFHHNQKANC
jgi:hypothetical protein